MINRVGAHTQMISTQQKKAQNIQKQEKTGRVEEIKARIQNGEYKVDLDKTAEALAKTLL
ncbi:flagellar biosynthesis protein FlgM [Nautilia sp. PV-1]|uniref:flagellar biosynthesis anti-sigma factor FlgM n=1 Tax=Nautilia sp. PV-1 TaxID=2579250 RepID=UPI000FD993DB|nr:flagellar biosynthesis anti-sigma factor FlgM [Nautilia sp. PV-1]AZV47155.1 flagellar biosynthesis protein FlgM [Nautilia sp. PV-1]